MIEYDSKYLSDNFSNVCRFCLSQNNCVEILSHGMINEHLEKAIDFIVSKVDENDGLPNNICQKCLKCVLEFAELEQRCQEAYEILQQITELHSTNSQSCTEVHTEEISCAEKAEFIQNFEHENVDVKFNSIDESEQPLDETSMDEQAYTNYPESDNNDDESEIIKPSLRKGKNCPICGKFVSQLSKHLPMHSGVKRHACSYCSKQFAHDTTLRKHINSVHLKIKKYQCEHCPESFTDRSSLRYHDVVKHRDSKDFTCNICSKSYYTSTGLLQHNSLNHEQRKFKCDECGKMFAMKYHLKEHEKIHSDVRPYACSLCDRTFKRSKNLNEHLVTHRDGNT
ncbi:zinc finger protein 99-like [Ochlerotatus camptorhynchus]|uniref:zinc finger protein 99-like n=1 Tax=Ochlerotatus camptorhynchus TaxID=644619 RepID=UPI0031D8A78E